MSFFLFNFILYLCCTYRDRFYNPLSCYNTFKYIFLGGKPDKRSKIAGPEKGTYCGGYGVNLLANLNSKNTEKNGKLLELGSTESLDRTFEKVTLQTYIDQVNTYEQILNPLSVILEKGLGAGGPDYLGAEDLGWGPEGAQLGYFIVGLFCYICSFLFFLWLFSFTYALLAGLRFICRG
jgi:hypothetical protein